MFNSAYEDAQRQVAQVRELTSIAENGEFRNAAALLRSIHHIAEFGCTVAQLALAWVVRNPNTSTVILGASKPEQVSENLKAIEVYPKLTLEIMEKIDKIFNNKPPLPVGLHLNDAANILTSHFSRRTVARSWTHWAGSDTTEMRRRRTRKLLAREFL
jgi:diketogulonate reductase-like aldo/keto reductase